MKNIIEYRLSLYERYNQGVISKEERDVLLLESEEDYKKHMKKKEEAEKIQGKKLKNKKYKNPDKAELIYKGREKVKEDQGWTDSSPRMISDKMYNVLNRSHDYVRKLSNKYDEKSDKKVSLVKKTIHNITKTPHDHDLSYTTYDYSKDGYEKDGKTKALSTTTYGKYEQNILGNKISQGKKVKLDKNKKYYHCSDTKLSELKPQRESKSNRLDYDGVRSTYLYPNKRIYITDETPNKSFGKYIYELEYVPNEGYSNRIGYYIEPSKPIPVKDVSEKFK